MKRNPAIPSEPIRKATAARALLDFPLVAQRTGWTCGPAVVTAVLKYFHIRIREQDAADTLQTTKKHGTEPHRIRRLLYQLGLSVQMRRRTPLRVVRTALERGHPVIVLWNDWKGHYAVIIGYDKGHFLLADPANRKSGMRYHKTTNFRKHWHARVAGVKYRQLAIVCGKPC